MNKSFLLFFIILSLGIIGMGINTASAVYPGETQIVTYDGSTINNWTITGNLSVIDIELNGSSAYIQIPEDYVPSDFYIDFWGQTETGEVVHHHHHSSSTPVAPLPVNQTAIVNETDEINLIAEPNQTIENQTINESIPVTPADEIPDDDVDIDFTDNYADGDGSEDQTLPFVGKPLWEQWGTQKFLIVAGSVIAGGFVVVWLIKILIGKMASTAAVAAA